MSSGCKNSSKKNQYIIWHHLKMNMGCYLNPHKKDNLHWPIGSTCYSSILWFFFQLNQFLMDVGAIGVGGGGKWDYYMKWKPLVMTEEFSKSDQYLELCCDFWSNHGTIGWFKLNKEFNSIKHSYQMIK